MRAAAHCQLGRRPWAYRFKQQQSSAYVAALFHSILAGRAATTRQLGAPAPVLSRFDLFHGHIFLAPRQGANSSIGNNNGSSNTHQGGTTAQAMPPRGRAQRRMLCGTNSGAAARILQDSRVASTAAGSADVGVGILVSCGCLRPDIAWRQVCLVCASAQISLLHSLLSMCMCGASLCLPACWP